MNPRLRQYLSRLLLISTVTLTACVSIPNSGVYESPVLRNHRLTYLTQNPQLSPDIRHAIESQQVVAGMSRTDVMAAWGPPKSCSRVMAVTPSQTICVYADKTTSAVLGRTYRDVDYKSVYFESGRVVDWQLH